MNVTELVYMYDLTEETAATLSKYQEWLWDTYSVAELNAVDMFEDIIISIQLEYGD